MNRPATPEIEAEQALIKLAGGEICTRCARKAAMAHTDLCRGCDAWAREQARLQREEDELRSRWIAPDSRDHVPLRATWGAAKPKAR